MNSKAFIPINKYPFKFHEKKLDSFQGKSLLKKTRRILNYSLTVTSLHLSI